MPTINEDFLRYFLNLSDIPGIHYQEDPAILTGTAIKLGQGVLSNFGALVVRTGQFTGRSPQDRFIVRDPVTDTTVNWDHFNIPLASHHFYRLRDKMVAHLKGKIRWVRDCYVCAAKEHRLSIRVVNEDPWSNLFAANMFIRPSPEDLHGFRPGWIILHAPGFKANPLTDGTRQENFVVISFSEKTVLIGGTAYTGEIKKSMFSILNFLLPREKDILSMHCSANIGRTGDIALFFGLSGTGKTTLSTDPDRRLIGDDEHGWSDRIFNFEGGCYAKCVHLNPVSEPGIYQAIRAGALVENVTFCPDTNRIDFDNTSITENMRVSYPLNYVNQAITPPSGLAPKNIFFLTCDAYGVLPPVSRLSNEQVRYYFLNGYTARIAGTETGVREPQSTFSACFGAPFLPLHPKVYADLLDRKIKESHPDVWLVNTGWSGGSYGTGSRIDINTTRAILSAVLSGELAKESYEIDEVFGLSIPRNCSGVSPRLLNPQNTWSDKKAYNRTARQLREQFITNHKKLNV